MDPLHKPEDRVRINLPGHTHNGEVGIVAARSPEFVKADGDGFYVYALEGDMDCPVHGPGFLENELTMIVVK